VASRTYFFDPEDGGRLKLNGLHGVISQKMIVFITTSVKTSNPIYGMTFIYPADDGVSSFF
jgi:hypothetical protein